MRKRGLVWNVTKRYRMRARLAVVLILWRGIIFATLVLALTLRLQGHRPSSSTALWLELVLSCAREGCKCSMISRWWPHRGHCKL